MFGSLAVFAVHADNDDAGDEAITMTIEEAVEKLESSGIEVIAVPNPPLQPRAPVPVSRPCLTFVQYHTMPGHVSLTSFGEHLSPQGWGETILPGLRGTAWKAKVASIEQLNQGVMSGEADNMAVAAVVGLFQCTRL